MEKKSHEVKEEDEIDLIKGFNIENRELVDIDRVNMLRVDDKKNSRNRIRILYNKTRNLTIANYEDDPYQQV